MDADELRRVLGALGERRDRQGRGVGAEDRVGHHRLRLGGGLRLDLAVLEHRLDHEIDAGERGVVGGRGDARQHGVALRRGGAALVDLVGQALLDMRLALVGALLVAVDQHHLDAGLALTEAMPAPMKPAPRMPTFLMCTCGAVPAAARPC